MTPETCQSPDTISPIARTDRDETANVALANAFAIFSIEEDENYIRLSTFGQQVACWPANSPQGNALLKLEAERRAAPTLPADVKGLVDEWRKAMEDVTPGPWHTERMETSRTVQRLYVAGPSEIVHPHDGVCEPDRHNDRSFKEDDANMRFIARCSPDNITILLEALTAQSALLERAREIGDVTDLIRALEDLRLDNETSLFASEIETIKKAEAALVAASRFLADMEG